MKKISAVLAVIILIFTLTACTKSAGDFDSPDEAFEAMTNAAENGDYAKALDYYENGAVDSGSAELINWYYYSLAMNAYEENGCLGYAYNLLTDRCGDLFEPTQRESGNIQQYTRLFDGIYQYDRYFLYCADGKIALGIDTQLTGTVYCTGELVLTDDVYYWAEHNADGDDTLLYKLELSDSGLTLSAVSEENDEYSGTYSWYSGEMPVLVY